MIVLPIAGGHGNVVISQKAADMHIASATTRTGYVARGIAGKEAYSVVESYQTAARDILAFTVSISSNTFLSSGM